ncbi:Uncharacterised protein [Yersinia mollaretii]|nr:Uncharacterised protein [Yersinia mollaretii]
MQVNATKRSLLDGNRSTGFRRVQVLLALRARLWPTVFILAEHTEVNPVWQSSPW